MSSGLILAVSPFEALNNASPRLRLVSHCCALLPPPCWFCASGTTLKHQRIAASLSHETRAYVHFKVDNNTVIIFKDRPVKGESV